MIEMIQVQLRDVYVMMSKDSVCVNVADREKRVGM